jgi:hypothetical protein
VIRTLAVSLSAQVLLSSIAAQGWVDKTPTNPLQTPSPRAFPTMCWDAAHGYVLLYAGLTHYGPGNGLETWSWNGTQWTRRLTTNQPPASASPDNPQRDAMAFHAPTNEVVLFADGSTWLWTGTDWLQHPAQMPTTPYPLQGGFGNVAMAHDPVRNHTVLFVGTRHQSGSTYAASQTFTWDGLGWAVRQTATSPWPVETPTMAFDPVAQRVVLGTNGANGGAYFEWTGTNWQQRFPAGAPSAPGALASDSTQQRVLMFDGVLNGQPNHTWTLANGAVQSLATPIQPARRVGAAMAYDPVRQRTVLFGGAAVWIVTPALTQIVPLGDTWEFQLGAGPSYTAYGAGCAGSRGVPALAASGTSLPRVGQPFAATVTNLPFTAPTFMFLGLSNTAYGPTPLPLSLGFLGAPGCSVLASGDDLSLVTNVLGVGLWQWTIPNAPGASFYNQAIVFDAAANPLGITVSNGAHGVIGF